MSVWATEDWAKQPAASRLPLNPAMVCTTETLAGYQVTRSLGVVEGISNGFNALLVDAMREAFLDMLQQAASHGAQAIVGLRYTNPGDLVMVYGTAVQVKKI